MQRSPKRIRRNQRHALHHEFGRVLGALIEGGPTLLTQIEDLGLTVPQLAEEASTLLGPIYAHPRDRMVAPSDPDYRRHYGLDRRAPSDNAIRAWYLAVLGTRADSCERRAHLAVECRAIPGKVSMAVRAAFDHANVT